MCKPQKRQGARLSERLTFAERRNLSAAHEQLQENDLNKLK